MENNVLEMFNKKAARQRDKERKEYMMYVAFNLRQLAGQQATVIRMDSTKKQSA
jgi:aspartate aminotransferase-like enzyme